MNRYRRRRSFWQRRPEPLQLCTSPHDRRLAELESMVTWIGLPGSHQPIASLPPRRWRWLLFSLLSIGDRWGLMRRAHDWLARRLGLAMKARGQ